jgi:hypothetical protein
MLFIQKGSEKECLIKSHFQKKAFCPQRTLFHQEVNGNLGVSAARKLVNNHEPFSRG